MRYGRYGTSYLLLRLALGITFLWIGIDMVRFPQNWIGYLPATIPFGLSRENALQGNALFDIGIGALLLLNKLPRGTSLFATLHLAGILVVNGIDGVLVRDVGLFGAALALFFWPHHRRRKFGWPRLWRRREPDYEVG